jgi:carbamoyltransferase|tara:strand:+ start:739 stop:2238 length:1500 start_codon:yes stop_codon:yes gene_type:complete
MKFLGLRLDEHDSNITYTDGVNVKYFKPERHNQIKHFGYNNLYGWIEAQDILGFKLEDIDAIAINLDVFRHPWCKKEDPKVLYEMIKPPMHPFKDLSIPIFRVDHHYSHSLSSWMLKSNSASDFVLDGFGDLYRSCSVFQNNKLVDVYTLETMFSLGKFLSNFGEHIGVLGIGDDAAGKLMALKQFGNINQKFYKYISQFKLQDSKKIYDFGAFEKIIGSTKASAYMYLDFLRTVHDYMEEAFPKFFLEHEDPTNVITYSGGIAHNVCINTKLKQNFPKLIIPPHCNDEGLSLGCVEFLRQYYNQPRFETKNFPFWQTDTAPRTNPSDKTIRDTAEDLANGKIIGWYQGHGEIGPRALGNRSILMSPEVTNGKHILNEKVKHREDYRPFAASIKFDKASEYFNWQGESEFMKYSVKFRDKVFAPISHIDQTSRIQTVRSNHWFFYQLLDEFEKLTGLPMLLNTSLNDNGKPIAGKPDDAIQLLKNSELDKLIVGNEVIE